MQLDEPSNDKADDEMDVSDEDEPTKKKHRTDCISEERNNLKDENESLRCQMEAYKNEVSVCDSVWLEFIIFVGQVEVLKVDYKKELDDKDKQFKMLQQTLQGMQQQLIEAKRKQTEEETKVKELHAKIKHLETKQSSEKDVITLDDSESNQAESTSTSESTVDVQRLNECDAKLVGIVSAFLNVHPFGAGLDYIWSYVSKLETNIRPSDIELLMNRFPTVFKQELVGIGANIERRWMFNAYNPAPTNWLQLF